MFQAQAPNIILRSSPVSPSSARSSNIFNRVGTAWLPSRIRRARVSTAVGVRSSPPPMDGVMTPPAVLAPVTAAAMSLAAAEVGSKRWSRGVVDSDVSSDEECGEVESVVRLLAEVASFPPAAAAADEVMLR